MENNDNINTNNSNNNLHSYRSNRSNEIENFYEIHSDIEENNILKITKSKKGIQIEKDKDKKKEKEEKININPNSIITNGIPIPLEERLKSYIRNPEGGVECKNYEELHSQDGIILDMMKRAGKQLLEGKNIVGISLPVKIFEPRSTLTRLMDIWGTGYKYFNQAAEISNPLERMKIIITMAMSGLHMNAKQTKPFNPILGETYEVIYYNKY